MLTWLVLSLFVAVAAVILWGKYRTRQRRPAVARFASQHGMSYSADGNIDTPGYDFPLLRKGDRNGYNNVLAGRWQDLPVKEADYWYSDTGMPGPHGSGSTYVQFSIVVVHLAATMPYVSVQTKNLFTRAAEHLGMHHIDFASEDFSQTFRVTAPDEGFAVKLIDAGMIQWLMSTGGKFAFDVGGGSLLVSCDLLPVTDLERLFDAAKGFTDHIPHVIWAEYGGQAANSHDGAPPS